MLQRYKNNLDSRFANQELKESQPTQRMDDGLLNAIDFVEDHDSFIKKNLFISTFACFVN